MADHSSFVGEDEMSLLHLVVKSSVQVVVVKKSDPSVRLSFGSGCIVRFQDRHFLITAFHTVDHADSQANLQLYGPNRGLESPAWGTGTLNLVTSLRLDPKTFEVVSEDDIDVAYCELPPNLSVLHPEVVGEDFRLPIGTSCYLQLEHAAPPVANKEYLFYCRVDFEDNGITIKHKGIFGLGLRYQYTFGNFHHLFNMMCNIERDMSGCSGAPIIDEDGRFAGIVLSVNQRTPLLFALSAMSIRTFLEAYVQSNEPMAALP